MMATPRRCRASATVVLVTLAWAALGRPARAAEPDLDRVERYVALLRTNAGVANRTAYDDDVRDLLRGLLAEAAGGDTAVGARGNEAPPSPTAKAAQEHDARRGAVEPASPPAREDLPTKEGTPPNDEPSKEGELPAKKQGPPNDDVSPNEKLSAKERRMLANLPVDAPDERLAPAGDQRSWSSIGLVAGTTVDTFSVDNHRKYLNPDDSGGTSQHAFAGVDMAVRLARLGKEPNFELAKKEAPAWLDDKGLREFLGATRSQLWLRGAILYGGRSATVNCMDVPREMDAMGMPGDSDVEACNSDEFGELDEERYLGVIRGATSLEAHLGARWEWPVLLGSGVGRFGMKPFLETRLGLIGLEESGDDVFARHRLMLGVGSIRGPFQDSYVEAGYGTNDLVEAGGGSKDRWVFTGHLRFRPETWAHVSAIMHFDVDTDMGRGADAIQTHVGLRWALSEKFWPFRDPTKKDGGEKPGETGVSEEGEGRALPAPLPQGGTGE